MNTQPSSRGRGRFSAWLLLAALLFRAYVPVGFMPAAGAPLQLALCPEGLAAPMPAHHDHHPSSQPHAHYEHCPFGSTAAGGPMLALLDFAPSVPAVEAQADPASLPRLPVRLSPAHPPRGPPADA